METSPTAWLFVLVAVVLGWFAYGVIGNIRRGNSVLRWLQGGLPKVGAKTTLRWLGSSVVELKIDDARPPFRSIEILLVLEPRDVPWLWLFARLQGRRDLMIVRGQLSSAPRYEFSLVAPGSWTGRGLPRETTARNWTVEPLETHLLAAGKVTLSMARPQALALLSAAREDYPEIWRLALRKEYPQLELHVPLPRITQDEALAYVERLRTLARKVADLT
jgi:hypothetical protein